jgi:hypothetical protein
MEGRRPLSNIQFAKEVVRVFPKVTRFKATLCSDRSWKWSGIRLAIEDVTSTVNSGHHY